MNDMTVSVAMAAYNGEEYISKQIESILSQLRESDELIISINPSKDKTEKIVKDFQNKDKRIKIFMCTKMGVLANFENAISHCNNKVVFLADQDDVWVSNKVAIQLKLFEDTSIGGVCHSCIYIDCNDELLDNQPKIGTDRKIRFWEIIKKNPVQGSTLAFRRELIKYFLPFPVSIPMHDSWIGIWICKKSKLIYINNQLLLYRQHDGTVTNRKHKIVFKMVLDRLRLLNNYLLRLFR